MQIDRGGFTPSIVHPTSSDTQLSIKTVAAFAHSVRSGVHGAESHARQPVNVEGNSTGDAGDQGLERMTQLVLEECGITIPSTK